jgi:hypothetical protein
LSVLDRELDRVERKARPMAPGATDRYEHLWQVIARLNAEMARDPRLAEAMARAFMVAYTAKGRDADGVRHRVVVDAWVSNAFCWLNRRAPTGDIDRRLWHLLAVLARRDGVQRLAVGPPHCSVLDEPGRW